MLPHTSSFQWNTFGFMTLGSSKIFPNEFREVDTMVSFALMTYFQGVYVKNEYFSRDWYSLPVLSFYHNEGLFKKILLSVKQALEIRYFH